jgi:hypothetical protein
VNEVQDLKSLLAKVVAEGDFGVTLRTGEPAVVHSSKGPRTIDGTSPGPEGIMVLLRQLTGSRGVRELREHGVTRFMVPFGDGVPLVGAARFEKEDIHMEVRRMAGNSK